MTIIQEISDVAKETIEVLKYFDATFVYKIPTNLLDTLKELAKESNIIVNIDKEKNLSEQNISEETKNLISLMYYDYIATEDEKEQIAKIWNENELVYQENLKIKYDSDNLFKKDKGNYTEQEISNLPIVIKKESFIRKIINFLKNILNKNIKETKDRE